MSNIFNTNKTIEEYSQKKLFLNSNKGLINTIHKHYPKIWNLYKEMKSLDWSEDEFNYSQCLQDFKTADPQLSKTMLATLSWQWEADSVVATSPICLIAPFNPSIEVWETEAAITTNELVHANTYSEIVRMSFDNPDEVLADILANQHVIDRMNTVNQFLDDFAQMSLDLANGKTIDEEEQIAFLMMYYFSLLLLERIQFMASFAVTFTICKSGLFSAIGMAVKKIAQDELEVHCEYRKEIIKELRMAYPDIYDRIKNDLLSMFNAVVDTEMIWTENLFQGTSIVGLNENLVKQWVLYNAKDVAKFSGIELDYQFPIKNPIPHLDDWFNMNKSQAAPQEQDNPAYKVNIVSRDDDNIKFDF